jgi:hypothetical protein
VEVTTSLLLENTSEVEALSDDDINYVHVSDVSTDVAGDDDDDGISERDDDDDDGDDREEVEVGDDSCAKVEMVVTALDMAVVAAVDDFTV